ncbi:hypothetical protein [Propionivibrio sp.]|uniref:hypothetical protein n=1 Tax=Propionivibrio sp. TaxID=2212460 RepID=UPI003BF2A14A
MTLENLLDIHRLQPFDVTPAGLQRLLASVEGNLADARLPEPIAPTCSSKNTNPMLDAETKRRIDTCRAINRAWGSAE